MSDPADLYARLLVAVPDHDDLLGIMVHQGADERYPEATSLQVLPCRANT